jgi:CHAD domain-containing protein
MAVKIRETEWKYEAPTGAVLPDLALLPRVGQVTAPEKQALKATYLDTDDLRLIRAGITLRRRSGGDDAGWHLKLPEDDGSRIELRLPLSRDLPEELAALVRAWTRGHRVRPVARITTKRERRLLQDQSGSTLAEVVVDDVTAESLGSTTTVSRWSEVEVELVAGGQGLLAAADEQLRQTGLVRSTRAAKLGRALADRLPDQADRPAPKPTGSSPAGEVVLAYVREHVDELTAWDPRLRQAEPDSVHQMRVATRRLRSTLKTFDRLFDPDQARPLGDELAWLSGLLGRARDEEVLCEQLMANLAQLPAELTVGPVQARIVGHFAPRQALARADVLTALDGDRYIALLDGLDALLNSPSRPTAASRQAEKELPKTVGKALRRVDRRMDHAFASSQGPERDVALHQARKATKRARYAAEALGPMNRKKYRRSARTMKKLQSALGDHQDSVITGHTVRELGMLAHMNGENGFTYGVLYEREAAAVPHLQARAEQLWKRR